MLQESRIRLGTLVLCASVLAACDGVSGPEVGAPLDPSGAESTLTTVVETLGAPAEAFTAVELAVPSISTASAALAPGGDGLMPSLNRIRTLPDAPSAALFPSNFLGKTFVWDTATDEYVMDQALTGAPANGVRLLYYGVDPVTDRPIEPLVQLGHVDLTDLGTASSWRLGIQVVNTAGAAPVTHVDYFIDASWNATQTRTTVLVQAEGYVSDGQRQLDLDLDHTAYIEESGEVGFAVDDVLSIAGEDASIHFTSDGAVSLSADQPATMALNMTISDDGRSASIDADIVDDALTGTIAFGGVPQIDIGGTTSQPTFTQPDGSPLDQADIQALHDLWQAIEDFMAFAGRVFAPFGATGA